MFLLLLPPTLARQPHYRAIPLVGLGEVTAYQIHVPHGHYQRAVAEEMLEGMGVSTGTNVSSGETVPDCVTATLPSDARPPRNPLDYLKETVRS